MNPALVKILVDVVLMLAAEHPEILTKIIVKVGPDLATTILKILSHIEIKPPHPETNLGG